MANESIEKLVKCNFSIDIWDQNDVDISDQLTSNGSNSASNVLKIAS